MRYMLQYATAAPNPLHQFCVRAGSNRTTMCDGQSDGLNEISANVTMANITHANIITVTRAISALFGFDSLRDAIQLQIVNALCFQTRPHRDPTPATPPRRPLLPTPPLPPSQSPSAQSASRG